MKSTPLQTVILSLCLFGSFILCAEDQTAKTYRARAITALNERCYSVAVDYVDKYLPLVQNQEPERQEAILLKATALLKNGSPQEALEVINQYTKMPNANPQSKQLMFVKAETLAQLDQWQQACAILEHCIDLTGDGVTPDEILLLANCRMKLGLYTKAEELLISYRQKYPNPSRPQLQFCLIEVLLAQKKYQQAEQLLNQLPVNPQNKIRIELLKIRCLLQANKCIEAQAALDAIINYLPEQSDYNWFIVTYELDEILLKNKTFDKLGTYLQYTEKMAHTSFEKARTYILMIQYALDKQDMIMAQNALDHLKRTNALHENTIQLTLQLALLQETKGNYNRAAELYLETAQTPGCTEQYLATFNAARCLEKAGKLDDAIQFFQQAEKLAHSEMQQVQAAYQAALVTIELYRRHAATSQLNFQPAADALLRCAETYGMSRNPDVACLGQKALIQLAMLHASVRSYKATLRTLDQFFNLAPSNHPDYSFATYLNWVAKRHTVTQLHDKKKIMEQLIDLGNKTPSIANLCWLEAYAIASECKLNSSAELSLGKIINKKQYAEAEYELALQQRIFYRIARGKLEEATKDYEEYVVHFASRKENDYLCLALGDAYSNIQDYAKALSYYSRSVQGRTGSEINRRYYESARCCYQMQQYDQALKFISMLPNLSTEPQLPSPDQQLICQAIYLQGDILTLMKEYEKAYNAYRQCYDLASDAVLKLSALGRMGDILMQMGTLQINGKTSSKLYLQAEECYTKLLNSDTRHLPLSHELRIIAKSHKAVCLVKQQRIEDAIRIYEELYIDLRQASQINQALYETYFQNTVLDMGILLGQKKDRQSLEKLRQYYNALAQTQLPLASTAIERMKKVEEQLKKYEEKQK